MRKRKRKKNLKMFAHLIIGPRGFSNHHVQAALVSLPYMQTTKEKLKTWVSYGMIFYKSVPCSIDLLDLKEDHNSYCLDHSIRNLLSLWWSKSCVIPINRARLGHILFTASRVCKSYRHVTWAKTFGYKEREEREEREVVFSK